MRYLVTPLRLILSGLVLSVLIAGVATAEDDAAKKGDRNDRRAEMRQRILEEFDADGDGEMNEDERATAREEMRKRRGRQGKGDRAKGERGPKHNGRRDGQRDGRGGGRPNPDQLFDRFDANDDGQLSRAEFIKLSEEVRANRPRHGHANRKGSRRDGAQLHKRHSRAGEHRGGHGGMRDGRGPRHGPPEGDGSPRRPRQPRPESDAGPELRPTDDNSV